MAYDRFSDKPDYRLEHRGPFRFDFVRTALGAVCPGRPEGWN